MLARIDGVPGVRSAEIDHSGELLRLDLDDRAALDRVRDTLGELGYAGQELPEPAIAGGLRWHRAAGARDLSWEEAQVIASRVVPPFARAHRLDAAMTSRLRDAIAGALFACFTAHPLAGPATDALRDACAHDVERAVRPLVGDELARALVEGLWAGLT